MHEKMENMKQKWALPSGGSPSSTTYRSGFLAQLRSAIHFDAVCCTSVDPITLLSTGALTEEGVEAIHHRLFEFEYVHDDYNKYEDLIKTGRFVGTLSGATNGRLERSPRFREVLNPAGFGDELRAALMYDGSCWGYLTLFRRHHRPFFQQEECDFLRSFVPSIAFSLRKETLALPSEETTWIGGGPGILVLSDQLSLLSSNTSADYWLKMLRQWESLDDLTLPRPIRAVCSRAQSEMVGLPDRSSMAKVCIRMPDGPYLSIRASVLNSPAGNVQLAVWIEPAKPADILPIIAEAYGLTEREKQILDRILRAFSTKELASSLYISTYTVQDHLKAIFAKTGVNSRRELMSQLLSRYALRPDNAK